MHDMSELVVFCYLGLELAICARCARNQVYVNMRETWQYVYVAEAGSMSADAGIYVHLRESMSASTCFYARIQIPQNRT